MDDFFYQSSQSRVIFGSGSIRKLPGELARLSLSKPLILCTSHQVEQANRLNNILEGNSAGIFSEATMHTPIEVTQKALEVANALRADSIISIGGGSTVGLGKAISFQSGLYHLTVPTTYAGSEVTPILGETKDGRKTTQSDPKILPGTVIYDVDLTMTLPVGLTATSGINAIAHAVEALYARNRNPVTTLLAREGIRALAASLPELVQNPTSLSARSSALYGAWLCGSCLGSVGMSLHHKLCHTLGGSFNLPHAETHTIVLPHALAYNAPSVPTTMRILADVLPDSDGDAVQGLNALLDKLGVKRDLKSLGLQEGDISKAAEVAVTNKYWNPREVEQDKIQELIRRAWDGEDAKANL